jgi:hypothetical protein
MMLMSGFRKAILYAVSPFAMLANKINWRFGRPYKTKYDSFLPHISRFAPGMIILSHKDYELTNWFIRGYWTHVAMFASQDYIIEAVGRGVVRTPVKDFFSSIDDFIILEPKFCSRASMLEAVNYVQKYVGYPYNFKFLQSDRSFTCIDLICRAYDLSINNDKRMALTITGLMDYITEEVIMPQSILNLDNTWNVIDISDGQIEQSSFRARINTVI